MNIPFIKSTLSLTVALTLTACGGSGGDVAGIGGSGFTSSGSISGFGSVFVNGVEFETDSATFDVDGASGTQADLAIGMVVRVNGSINADGVSGTASSISFDDELQGPVDAPPTYDADRITATFTVLGVNVVIDSSSTTFDVSDDVSVPPNTAFGFDTIAADNNVEISGFFNSAGDLIATRVELKDTTFIPDSSIVEVEGIITSFVSNSDFKVRGITVDASAATLDDLPNGLADNQLVEVKGTLNAVRTILTASKVEAEDNSADDTDKFELEGIITGYTNINTPFTVNGITVDASNSNLELEPSSLTLENDLLVEVEGAIVNGVLIASEIELEGGDFKVHALVTAVPPDTAANTFEVEPVSGQVITITVSTDTQFENDVIEDQFFNLGNLTVGNFVEVQGFDDAITGGISATEVEVREPSDIIVQGDLQDFVDNNSIKVLGITFTVDYNDGAGETTFEDTSDDPIDQDTFSADAPMGTLVKIEDKKDSDFLGTADEIDIEEP